MGLRDRLERIERDRNAIGTVRREVDGQGWVHLVRRDRHGTELVRVSLPPNLRSVVMLAPLQIRAAGGGS